MRLKLFSIILLILTLSQPVYAQSNGTLVLMVDTSHLLQGTDIALQMEAYRSAFREIRALRYVNIELIFFSDVARHVSSGNVDDALLVMNSFSNRLPSKYRGATCVTKSLKYVEEIFHTLPKPVVIDISGDGEANCSNPEKPLVRDTDTSYIVLDRLEQMGARVNTLLINKPKDDAAPSFQTNEQASEYYRNMVRGGGFNITETTFDNFLYALFRKLVQEVAHFSDMRTLNQL